MGFLKGIGYVLAAVVVLAILCSVGALVSAIVLVGGVLLTGAIVVALIALLIKEYFETKPARPKPGDN